MQAKRKFPSELEMHAAGHIQQHLMSSHPECQFCRKRFYGPDELYSETGTPPLFHNSVVIIHFCGWHCAPYR